MLNDVLFNNDISAYEDWHIVLTKREIPFPAVKSSTVDIKGMDGVLDLTEVLTGEVEYNNREIKLTFEILDDSDWDDKVSEIASAIHGKVSTLSLSSDSDWYYKGRCSISPAIDKRQGTIEVTMDAYPYKFSKHLTVVNVTASGTGKSITLQNDRMKVCPTLEVTGSATLTFGGKTVSLSEGKQQVLNFVLGEGENVAKFGGSGNVKITYRKGRL